MSKEETALLWSLKADNDLKCALHEIEHDDPALDTVCFHAQQSVEKYLKAFLIISDQEIPRTHILIRLIKTCSEVDPTFLELLEKNIDELTDYAIEIRYANDFYMPDIQESREAIRKAEFVRDFIRIKMRLI